MVYGRCPLQIPIKTPSNPLHVPNYDLQSNENCVALFWTEKYGRLRKCLWVWRDASHFYTNECISPPPSPPYKTKLLVELPYHRDFNIFVLPHLQSFTAVVEGQAYASCKVQHLPVPAAEQVLDSGNVLRSILGPFLPWQWRPQNFPHPARYIHEDTMIVKAYTARRQIWAKTKYQLRGGACPNVTVIYVSCSGSYSARSEQTQNGNILDKFHIMQKHTYQSKLRNVTCWLLHPINHERIRYLWSLEKNCINDVNAATVFRGLNSKFVPVFYRK